MRFLQNLLIPMRDGVRIAADVYLPDGEAACPVVLYFGPYRKDDYITRFGNVSGLESRYTERGMALAVADVRGTNNSEGVTRFMFDIQEQQDGYEVVEWLAAQPWCDGHVGMTGTSYGFFTSLLTAAQQPPHLTTVVPINGSVTWFYCLEEGGLPQVFGYHGNYMAIMISMQGSPPGYRDPMGCWRTHWKRRLEEYVPWGLEWFGCQVEDAYWVPPAIARVYDRIRVPVFVIGGWWDRYASDPFKLYEAIQGPTKVLVGPWLHMRMDYSAPGPRVDYDIVLRWFEYWLKGQDNGIMNEPPVTFYAQRYGTPASYRALIPGTWRQEDRWPIVGTERRRLYLQSGNMLDTRPPEGHGRASYDYDPTTGASSGLSGGIYGPIGMPLDQRPDEAGSLVYTSAALDQEVEVTGIPRARLHFSSTATRMGVVAKLCDVAPDGTVALVTRGYLNATHWAGHDQPALLEPGKPYELDIEMKATSYRFEPGHRIRLAVTSAEFPTALPTPEPGTNTVYYSPAEASYLELPVAPPPASPDMPLPLRVLPSPAGTPPADRTYTMVRDDKTGTQSAVLDVSGRFRGPEGWIEHRHRTAARVHPNRPAEVALDAEASFLFEYDAGEQIESHASVRIRGDFEALHTDAELRVRVDGAEHFHRSWQASHPRRFI